MSNPEIIICQICERELGIRGFGGHLKHKHQLTYKEYYDTYLKKEGEGICRTCGEETEIYRGDYRKYCSNKCGLSNPDAVKNRIEVRKRTMKDNPKIEEERKEKFKQTLVDNPEIMINAARKNSKTLADNPEIVKNRIEVYKKTLKDNPEINIKRAEKTRQTLVDNPLLEEKRKNNVSKGHRNYYKSITDLNSTEIHCLYIMEHQSKPIIKIGFSSEKNLSKRTTAISNDFGKSIHILILKASYKIVNKVETFLHDHFDIHCKVQLEKRPGRTEWFDKEIMAEAVELASAKIEEIS